MADLETLGVVVTGEGITETVRALDQLTESGGRAETSATRLREASGQLSRAQQEVARMAREVADAQRVQEQAAQSASLANGRQQAILQAQARESATAAAHAIEQVFDAESARIKEGIARGFLTPAQAREAGREAAQAYNAGVVSQLDRLGATGLNAGNSRVYTDLASSLKTVQAPLRELETQGPRVGASINTIRASMTSLLASSLQTAPGVAQVGSAVGALALGTGVTVGVLAGVAAITAAYHVLTDESKREREEQDKLVESLDRWYQKQRDGDTGEFERSITAKIAQLKDLRAALDDTLNRRTFSDIPEFLKDVTRAFVLGSFNPAEAGREFDRLWSEYVQHQKETVTRGAAEVAAAGREAFEREQRAQAQTLTTQTSQISGLIAGGTATGSQVRLATESLAKYTELLRTLKVAYDGISDAKAKAFNLEQQVSAANNIRTIEDALRTAILRPLKEIEAEQARAVDGMNAYVAANKDALDAITKNGDAIRSGAAVNADALRQSEQSAALARTEGAAREYLTNQFKAENAAIEANRTLSGIALRERLETIAATRQQADETSRLRLLTDLLSEAQSRAAKNTAAEKARLAELTQEMKRSVVETANAVQSFTRSLHGDLAESIRNGLRDGFGGFDQLLDSVLRGVDALAPEIGKKFFSHQFTQTTDTGAQITSTVPGLSARDAERLSTFGAVFGAVQDFANALNSLTGAVNKSAAQINQDIVNRIGARQSLEQYRISAIGNPVEQQLAQIGSGADQQRAQIETAYAGKHFEDERNKLLAQIASIEQQQIAKLRTDFGASIIEQLNALNGASGAYANQLAAIDKAYADNKAAAIALGLPLDEVTRLYEKQKAAAEAAYAEGQKQIQFSLDAREAAAKGETFLADQISRRAAHEKELFDDQAAGYTDAQLAQVKFIQGLLDMAAALAAFNDAQNTYLQNIAKGPTGTLTDQLAADLSPLTQRLAQDTTNYNAAVKTLADDMAAGADEATIAADKTNVLTQSILVAGDQAAITAAKFQAAAAQMQQAQSDIQRDIALGFKTPGQGREAEAQAFGFGGLTDQQIRDRYTPYAGTPLTNEQEQINKNIEQFFRDFPPAVAEAIAGAVNNTAAARAVNPSDAVSYAARNLSEITGNRMADYLATDTLYLRDIRDDVRRLAGGPAALGGAPFVAPGYGENRGVQPASVAGIDVNALAAVLAPRLTATVAAPAGDQTPRRIIIEHRIDPITGKIDRSDLQSVIQEIAEELEDELTRRAVLQRLADGSPLLSGA